MKESKRHCRLFKAKSSRCFYEIDDLLGHILQSRGLLSKMASRAPKNVWKQGRMGAHHILSALDLGLGLANILIDDITDAELLLLLHPHQLHTLMDKNVLLLCLHHRHPVRPHFGHQP